jgi:hypothetical protein
MLIPSYIPIHLLKKYYFILFIIWIGHYILILSLTYVFWLLFGTLTYVFWLLFGTLTYVFWLLFGTLTYGFWLLFGTLTDESKREWEYNGQKKKDKRTNNDLQNITHRPKYRIIRIPLKTGVGLSFIRWFVKRLKRGYCNCSIYANLSSETVFKLCVLPWLM